MKIKWIGLFSLWLYAALLGSAVEGWSQSTRPPFQLDLVQLAGFAPEQEADQLDSLLRLLVRYPSDTVIHYGSQMLERAYRIEAYDMVAAISGQLAHRLNTFRNDPRGAEALIRRALNYEDQFLESYSRGTLYAKLGGVHFIQQNYSAAIRYYDVALQKFGEGDSLNIADMYFFKGQAYSNQGAYLESAEQFKRAYAIYASQGDSIYLVESMAELADLYSRSGLHFKALEEYQTVDSLSQALDYLSRRIVNQFNISQLHYRLGRDSQRMAHLALGLELYPQLKAPNPYLQHRYWCALVQAHVGRGAYPIAQTYLDSIEQKEAYYLQTAETQAYYLWAKLSLLLARNQLDAAAPLLQSYLQISRNGEDVDRRLEVLQLAQRFYQKKKDYASSNQYLRQYYELKDSLRDKHQDNQLLYYQTAFETERKEQQLRQQQVEIEQLERKRANTWRLLLLVLLALCALFGMVYLNTIRRQALVEKQLQENFAAQLIEQQEQEKKRTSESLHDGLGQQLLLIKNQAVLSQQQPIQDLVDRAIDEVSSITKALHPLQLEQLGLSRAIKSNIEALDDSSDIFFSSQIDPIDGRFDKVQELNIYRMVQEVLSNVVKHSQARACKVALEQKTDQIQLTIQDNGRGFDWSKAYQKMGSLGLKTLRSRVQQLEGQLSFESQRGTGTRVSVIIPIDH
ncbi:MAG: sensor histidine kinase [Bacteroidota bacterium]